MLGYPDQAAALSDAKDEHARQRNHPFDLCFALTVGAQVFDHRREPEALLERVDEAIRVGREHRIPLMSEVMAQLVRGAAWLRAGRPADASELLRATLTELGKTGHRAWVPYVRVNLAEAVALTGDFDGGLALVEESLEQMERQGERVHFAEALRRKGWMQIQTGDLDGAVQTLDEAVRFARDQGTRSWQLRASTTRARLLAERGDPEAARELLAPIYDWFTEDSTPPTWWMPGRSSRSREFCFVPHLPLIEEQISMTKAKSKTRTKAVPRRRLPVPWPGRPGPGSVRGGPHERRRRP